MISQIFHNKKGIKHSKQSLSYLNGEGNNDIGRYESEEVSQKVDNPTRDIEPIGDVYRSKQALKTRRLVHARIGETARSCDHFKRVPVVGHVHACVERRVDAARVRIQKHVQERTQRVLEEMHQQEQTVREAQEQQVNTRRVIPKAFLHKHVHAEAVANQSYENKDHRDKDVDYANRLVHFDRSNQTLAKVQLVLGRLNGWSRSVRFHIEILLEFLFLA
jgi:hypothetical protein